ncbi:GDSL-type esterase/lipase family protein [Carnobacterium gallinarum]|uniref:GDSL-type esterase/lipase family protein n=1 Tax=Carnobacterium gallinarum TaxID=2749 RepID=UPI000A5AF132|nr:GDSL-type esterase/lipase family protein [Carnobacterium gallinarum]
MFERIKVLILSFVFMLFLVGGGHLVQAGDTVNPSEYVPAVNLITTEGEAVDLPKKVNVSDANYNLSLENVTWESMDSVIFNQAGTYEVNGITASQKKATTYITVYSKEQTINISAIGDSITYGMNVENVGINSYPKQLNYRLGNQYNVVNFGNSGKTLLETGDDPYIRTGEYTRSLVSNPNVVVIQLGTNDSKYFNFAKIDNYIEDYLKLVKNYQNLPTKPIIYISLPPKAFSSAYSISQQNIEQILPKIVEVSQKADLPVSIIDNQSATLEASSLIPDGVHPNAKGAALIANNVYHTLKGEPRELTGKTAVTEYGRTYGAINSQEITGGKNLYLSGMAHNSWVSYENVNLDANLGAIQLFAAVPYAETKVTVRLDSATGPIIGEQMLTQTANNSTWNFHTIPVEKATGNHTVYFTFTNEKVTDMNYELVRLSGIDFNYDPEKPVEAASAAELEALLASGLTNIKLIGNITLTKNLFLNADTRIDLNGFLLNADNYYLTKNESINMRTNLTIFNGSVTGRNSYGAIFINDSENLNYGMTIEISDVNFNGVLFIRNNVKDADVTFDGHNEVRTTTGSNVYARNITIKAGAYYYGSTEGGGSSNESGSTVFTLGTSQTDKLLTIEHDAKVELYPGNSGTGYGQNAVYGFSKISVGENATFIAKGERPMLRTEYTVTNAQVIGQAGSTVDLQTNDAVEGISFSYGIDYTFNQMKYLNLESKQINKYSFMYAYRTSSIQIIGNDSVMSVWNKNQNSSVTEPNASWIFNNFTLSNFTNSNNMGTVSSDSDVLKNQFATINNYNRILVESANPSK